jgi:hypothetical protein
MCPAGASREQPTAVAQAAPAALLAAATAATPATPAVKAEATPAVKAAAPAAAAPPAQTKMTIIYDTAYQMPADFDWKMYLRYYPDLLAAGVNNEQAARQHYESSGRHEGRVYKQLKVLPPALLFCLFDRLAPLLSNPLASCCQLLKRLLASATAALLLRFTNFSYTGGAPGLLHAVNCCCCCCCC